MTDSSGLVLGIYRPACACDTKIPNRTFDCIIGAIEAALSVYLGGSSGFDGAHQQIAGNLIEIKIAGGIAVELASDLDCNWV